MSEYIDTKKDLREVLREEQNGLQSLEPARRRFASLNDFYTGVTTDGSEADIDKFVERDSAGNVVKIFGGKGGLWWMGSRKLFKYPFQTTKIIWDTRTGRSQYVGFEGGMSIQPNFAAFWLTEANLWCFTGNGVASAMLNVENFLPADYNSAYHVYSVKLNRNNVLYWVDSDLVAVFLLGLHTDIPSWDGNPPYAIYGNKAIYCASHYMIGMEVGNLPVTLQPHPNTPGVADGDPITPLTLPVYRESTNVKWNGLATGGVTQTSHPLPIWGYSRKTLAFQSSAAGTLDIQVYAGGDWRSYDTPGLTANKLLSYNFPQEMQYPIMRLVYEPVDADTIACGELFLA
jgi:hypothetical protein